MGWARENRFRLACYFSSVTTNRVARQNKGQDRKMRAILEVILDLTCGKPNAYKAFDVALRKVGVFLPPPKE